MRTSVYYFLSLRENNIIHLFASMSLGHSASLGLSAFGCLSASVGLSASGSSSSRIKYSRCGRFS